MEFFDWLAQWIRKDSRSRGGQRQDKQRRAELASERFELRQLPAVFTMRSDVPDGQPGSLRDAVVQANQNRQSDVIQLLPGRSTLGRDDNQYLVTNPAGQELIRGSLTTDVLVIQGSDADDHLLNDWTDGNPIPEYGLRFLARQTTTGDSLEFVGSPFQRRRRGPLTGTQLICL